MNKTALFWMFGVALLVMGIISMRQEVPKGAGPVVVTPTPAPVAIANPASVFCSEHGGTLTIKDTPDGQSGVCTFPGGVSCEEWALFRGECNIAGVSNTGVYSDGIIEVRVVYRIKEKNAILIAPTLGYENLSLTETMSGSGARYLSADGTVEFWEHQGEGKLSVDEKQIFLGRVK